MLSEVGVPIPPSWYWSHIQPFISCEFGCVWFGLKVLSEISLEQDLLWYLEGSHGCESGQARFYDGYGLFRRGRRTRRVGAIPARCHFTTLLGKIRKHV